MDKRRIQEKYFWENILINMEIYIIKGEDSYSFKVEEIKYEKTYVTT